MFTFQVQLAQRAESMWLVYVFLVFATSVSDAKADPVSAEAPNQRVNARRPTSDEELRYWLELMVWEYRYTELEIQTATGLTPEEIRIARQRLGIGSDAERSRQPASDLRLLPYPGGRHPRIGFRDGAVRPQRETKAGVFTPWNPTSYVVLDVPEAIFSNLGLLYLAHTHVPTIWDRKGVKLPELEWTRNADGGLSLERRLPNGVSFGTRLMPRASSVGIEMWLTNGTDQRLSDLRVQVCALLRGAPEFNKQTNDNKYLWRHYAACRNQDGTRWVIVASTPLDRVWSNERCPCLHADPRFPDCEPGQTVRVRGWLSFYEGADIDAELRRIEATGWDAAPQHESSGQ